MSRTSWLAEQYTCDRCGHKGPAQDPELYRWGMIEATNVRGTLRLTGGEEVVGPQGATIVVCAPVKEYLCPACAQSYIAWRKGVPA